MFCHAEPQAKLVAIQVDSLSTSHVYGLSANGNLYVFRTSNLLQSPEAKNCYLETKIKVAEQAYNMITVKGGIVIDTDLGSLYLNASTFVVNRFAKNPNYELPKPTKIPFNSRIYEFKTQSTSLILTSSMELFELFIPYVQKEQNS